MLSHWWWIHYCYNHYCSERYYKDFQRCISITKVRKDTLQHRVSSSSEQTSLPLTKAADILTMITSCTQCMTGLKNSSNSVKFRLIGITSQPTDEHDQRTLKLNNKRHMQGFCMKNIKTKTRKLQWEVAANTSTMHFSCNLSVFLVGV